MPVSFYAEQYAKAQKAHPKLYTDKISKQGELISPGWVSIGSKGVKVPDRFKPTPGKICAHCGAKFWKKKLSEPWEEKRFCSLKCLGLASQHERT